MSEKKRTVAANLCHHALKRIPIRPFHNIQRFNLHHRKYSETYSTSKSLSTSTTIEQKIFTTTKYFMFQTQIDQDSTLYRVMRRIMNACIE